MTEDGVEEAGDGGVVGHGLVSAEGRQLEERSLEVWLCGQEVESASLSTEGDGGGS